ncbi:MAG: CzcA family heavy metal efflux pump, partial [Pirellulaceae bacterium]
MSRLLNGVIAFALHNRLLIVGIALSLIVFGSWTISELPIDVFPDLNRPRVVVITEAHGLAPEEVETLVTYPLEAALNGANGVQAVRSSSGVGISVIYVEFDWGTKILDGRQVVDERISLAAEQLPPGIQPQLAPISSIMGQISIVGMYSQPNARSLLFRMIADLAKELDAEKVPIGIKNGLRSKGIRLSNDVQVLVEQYGKQWTVLDKLKKKRYTVLQSKEGVEVHSASSTMELRTYADWVVRQQLRTVEGVAQVFVMGGDHKQYQVLVKPRQLLKYGVTLHEVEEALRASNQNATGGYLDQQGPNELLVRVLGRISSAEDLTAIVIDHHDGVSVTLGQVAEVIEGAEVKRGDAAAFYREEGSEFSGGPAVVLTINKQPGGDTRKVTEEIEKTLEQIQERLPGDIVIKSDLYQQSKFIDLAIDNVVEALTHGALLVVIVLFLFLFNIRTTFITLTAIPLSIVITGLVFYAFGQTINTMTLGGIAVAIGELVDDAIVDVENIFRRLRENKQRDVPLPAILVVFRASVEVRNSIVFGTLIVVLVFLPLFALSGMEGRLFAPLGVAYIVSIFSSLFVSLTVTPVLSYWLLRNLAMKGGHTDSFIVRALKWLAHGAISLSVKASGPILIIAVLLVAVSGLAFMQIERDFLPPFDEGAVQVNILMPPGTSLRTSTQIAVVVDEQLLKIPDVLSLVRKTGRAEADEHAEGVNVSEMILAIDP